MGLVCSWIRPIDWPHMLDPALCAVPGAGLEYVLHTVLEASLGGTVHVVPMPDWPSHWIWHVELGCEPELDHTQLQFTKPV